MRDVLVVDDDFMVAEIHRRFVEQVDGFRAAAQTEPAPVPRPAWFRPKSLLRKILGQRP